MASSQLQKVEANVNINASAEQFYEVLCCKTYHIASICPELVQSVEILEGEWGTNGSIICWHYFHDGKLCVAKEVIGGIDKKNNKMVFTVIEADLLQYHKSVKFIMEVTPKGKGNELHWIIEYEKQNDNIPDPHTLLQLTVKMSAEIDAYLTQNKK